MMYMYFLSHVITYKNYANAKAFEAKKYFHYCMRCINYIFISTLISLPTIKNGLK